MRIVRLHNEGSTTLGSGESKIDPRTSLVGLIAKVGGSAGASVSSTFSVMGEVNGFAPEPIMFGGASIISLSGTTSAQWSGQVDNCGYSTIGINLLSLGSVSSFTAAATEAEV